jgi:transposase
MVRAAKCGFRRRPRTRSCSIIPLAAASATLVRFGFATASSSFLKALYRASTMGSRGVVVITDNARYHHARLHRNWREENANRFVLDYLPPYSPDLNPIERVWKLTRRQCLHNRYFPLLSEVTDSDRRQSKRPVDDSQNSP